MNGTSVMINNEDETALVKSTDKQQKEQISTEGPPPLQHQDSSSTHESADSPYVSSSKSAERGVVQAPSLLPDAVGLQRQLTMGGLEQLETETIQKAPMPMLMRQDTLIETDMLDDATNAQVTDAPMKATASQPQGVEAPSQTSGSNGKKRAARDLQPEPLLKRQETNAGSGLVTDSAKASPTLPLYRQHSLIDPEEEEEDLQGEATQSVEDSSRSLSIRSPIYDVQNEEARDSPMLFSPPCSMRDLVFKAGSEEKGLPSDLSKPLSPGPFPNARPFSPTESEGDLARPSSLVPITRQESWKEDVSDAGWRAW